MPRIKASQRMLTESEMQQRQPLASPPQMPPPDPLAVSPFMVSSVPARAASYDAFQRQFYGRGVPLQRILTPNLD